MLSTAYAAKKAKNQKVLLTILSTIHFLARQGLPLRGNYLSNPSGSDHGGGEVHRNFWQLLLLRTEDVPLLESWLHRSQDRFTSPMIQNELLEIMAQTLLRKVVRRISGQYFTIIVDETTDLQTQNKWCFAFGMLMTTLPPTKSSLRCTALILSHQRVSLVL